MQVGRVTREREDDKFRSQCGYTIIFVLGLTNLFFNCVDLLTI